MNGLKAMCALSFVYLLLGGNSDKGADRYILHQQDTLAQNIRQIKERLYILKQNEGIKRLRQQRIDSIVALVKSKNLNP